jgi:hypothetical protein
VLDGTRAAAGGGYCCGEQAVTEGSEQSERERAPVGRWAQVRAVLIAAHVIAVVVLTLPGESAMLNARRWKTANAQDDLRRWAERLQGWGVDTDPQRLQQSLWDTATSVAAVREAIATPFQPYAAATRMKQGWAMFASPQRHPAEVHVDVFEDGAWRLVYRPHDDAHDWNHAQFEHNRFRKFFGRFAREFVRRHYDQTAHWIATAAAVDHPRATKIRVRLYRYASLPPERVRAGDTPEGRYEHPREFEAEALR